MSIFVLLRLIVLAIATFFFFFFLLLTFLMFLLGLCVSSGFSSNHFLVVPFLLLAHLLLLLRLLLPPPDVFISNPCRTLSSELCFLHIRTRTFPRARLSESTSLRQNFREHIIREYVSATCMSPSARPRWQTPLAVKVHQRFSPRACFRQRRGSSHARTLFRKIGKRMPDERRMHTLAEKRRNECDERMLMKRKT